MEELRKASLLGLKNKRDLPFPKDQGSLYQIWITRSMAQQTRIAALIPYFERFTSSFLR